MMSAEDDDDFGGLTMSSSEELKALWHVAWNPMITSLLFGIPGYINIALIGHTDNTHSLAAIAFGELITGSIGFTLSMGLTHTLVTCNADAFLFNQPMLVGLFLQRAAVVLLILFLAIAPLSIFSTEILLSIGMPLHASIYTASYTQLALFGLPFFFMSGLLEQALAGQQEVDPDMFVPGMYIALICLCVGGIR